MNGLVAPREKQGKRLSKREKQILPLIAEGSSNREIANLLELGEGTVKNYVSSLIAKLGVKNRMQVAHLFEQHGRTLERLHEWVDPGEKEEASYRLACEGGVQDGTVIAFKEHFGSWPDSSQMRVHEVKYTPETGAISIVYEDSLHGRFVTEIWQGCEYVGAGELWEGDTRDV